jgi:fused signal recognition particle receptor
MLLLILIVFAVVLLVASVAAIGLRRVRGPVEVPPEVARPADRTPTAQAGATTLAPPAEAPPVDVPAAAPPVEAPPVEAPQRVEAPPVEAPQRVEVPTAEAAAPEAPPKPRFRDRLAKARSLLAGYVGALVARERIDDETWEQLEEALVRADVGLATTSAILDDLRERVKADKIGSPQALLEALKADLVASLDTADRSLRFEPGVPNVWLFVGVNGVGKTTTIGKVALQQQSAGRSVVLAAGDTFRAAAAEQLAVWAERVGADLVRAAEGADPASVVYDAVQRAAARGIDLVLADTAGRLHTKVNLMEELKKVRRVAEREPGRVTEVLLVIDATTGQNGLVQARQFAEAVGVTGVVLTKLDGTAKGGIALAIQADLGIPIKLVGLGEGPGDLVPFDPREFVEALFE